ncbi:MAG TPA: alpha/beta fold hydrolase [Rhizomicrobium sp.]|nr:alpha/beta fold hydrolase [Rhizomicrobium sp.]
MEKNLMLDSGSGMLAGTLLTPDNPKAAILMLAGSGPTDRNGNALPALHSDTYRLLAEGLAAHGVTTLRVDKRGVGQSAAAMAAEADLRIGTYADDAKAWAGELRKQTGLRCVWLLGHSEGALVAELAAQNTQGICGLILISGAGHNLGDIIVTQTQSAPPELRQKITEIVATLRQGKTVADVPPPLMVLFRPSVQPYWISEINLDPPALLKSNTLPLLIMQGDNDIQVSVEDAKLLAAARSDAKLVILPGVNHLLKIAPTDRAGNIATYANPSLPLAPGVVDAVADFVHDHGS